MKLVDVKPITYIDFNAEKNDKYTEFEVDGDVRLSKYKNAFCKRLQSKIGRKKNCD